MPSGSADVVVIGAGIIGGSIAWRLAQRGIRVLLLDAGVMGAEASWAGAGMLAPGLATMLCVITTCCERNVLSSLN